MFFFVMAVKNILERVVRLNIKPFGIAAHSDMQGGQHEANLNPVQAAASLYTTLTVDGQNVDLNNIWRATDVSGGDKLIFRLEFVEMDIANESGKTIQFGLNHHKKSTVTRSLNLLRAPKPKLSGFFSISAKYLCSRQRLVHRSSKCRKSKHFAKFAKSKIY